MPNFFYRVRDSKGKLVTGTTDAISLPVLKNDLRNKGFLIVEVKEIKDESKDTKLPIEEKRASFNIPIFNRVTHKELAIFSRQFATLVAAGVPITRTLNTLKSQTKKKAFRDIIDDVLKRVEGGESLARALERHSNVFNKLYTSLIRAGEASGSLDVILARIASYLEKEMALRNQIKQAVSYPIFVLTIALALTAFLLMFIVPMFAGFLTGLGAKLPLMTLIIVNASQFMIHNFIWIVLVIIGGVFLFIKLLSNPVGREMFDLMVFRLPIFGPLYMKIECSRFARTFGSMTRSGVPILTSLEIIEGILMSVVLKKGIRFVHDSVKRGQTIADSMRKTDKFPMVLVEMIAIGEETGHLDEMLDKSADYYDDEVETTVKALSSMLEPAMIVIIGGIVGFIVIAMYLPIFSLYQAIVK
ncbi:type IV pilus assembly protein PilC [Thermodesulfobium acidiphilum]|uniref:General secretion pathway protein F n=1 Tax=Thermodesulfobium acidiphilum TaxID=1794699 RepID=A0A2R4VYR2_THEAF|nr:type II secretion system F family protein [Thermodesulfobium acidiphilum]AWB09683.1 type IV pilus assembly protein PilC [Thermodesulfobium acidiphilum]